MDLFRDEFRHSNPEIDPNGTKSLCLTILLVDASDRVAIRRTRTFAEAAILLPLLLVVEKQEMEVAQNPKHQTRDSLTSRGGIDLNCELRGARPTRTMIMSHLQVLCSCLLMQKAHEYKYGSTHHVLVSTAEVNALPPATRHFQLAIMILLRVPFLLVRVVSS